MFDIPSMCGMLFDKPMVYQAGSTERSEARKEKSEGRYSLCVGFGLEQASLIRRFIARLNDSQRYKL